MQSGTYSGGAQRITPRRPPALHPDTRVRNDRRHRAKSLERSRSITFGGRAAIQAAREAEDATDVSTFATEEGAGGGRTAWAGSGGRSAVEDDPRSRTLARAHVSCQPEEAGTPLDIVLPAKPAQSDNLNHDYIQLGKTRKCDSILVGSLI